MGVCRIIGGLIAAAAILVGAALIWRAIEEQDDATPLGKYKKMALRYDTFGIFLVGILTLLYAFVAEKFPSFSGMTTFVVIGLIYYTIMSSEESNALQLNKYRLEAACDDNTVSWQKKYFAGGLLSYLGFLMAIFSLAGYGFGNEHKVAKIVLLVIMTACAIVAIFLLSTSTTSALTQTACQYTYTTTSASKNVYAVTGTFYIWFLAFVALISGNRELAGGLAVLFGAFNFFLLQSLLLINDDLHNFPDDDAKQVRAGYVFAWFTAFAAILAAIPVYASNVDGGFKA